MTSIVPRRNRDNAEDAQKAVVNERCLLVQDEVWRVVTEAARKGRSLSLSHQAQCIEAAFPDTGISRQHIADALVFAAVDCDVLVDTSPALNDAAPIIKLGTRIRRGGRRRARAAGRITKSAKAEAAHQAMA